MIYHDSIGLLHFISAVLAIIFGTMILFFRKGTSLHKKAGYMYFCSMLIMNITAFMITRLFGGFGIFHFAAIISMVTLLAGIIPVIRRKPKNYIIHHFAWMYWSIMGLYAAFVSELVTRVPETPFFWMVGIGTGIVMGLGSFYYSKKKELWKSQFYKTKHLQT